MNIIRTVLIYMVEEVFKMHAVVRHVGIALSADFRLGRPFPSSTKSCTFDNSCWAVMNSE